MGRLSLLALLTGLAASTGAQGQEGSFFPAAPPPKDMTATPAPAATPAPDHAEPAPTLPPENTTVATAPPPAVVAPVARLHDLPLANWKNLSVFAAQRYGIDRLTRAFLTQFVALGNCALWHRDQNNEFVIEDHRRLAKEEITKAPVVTRLRVPVRLQLGSYDFDKGGFPLPQANLLSIQTRGSCPDVNSGPADTIPFVYRLQFTQSADLPTTVPVSRERGQSLVAAFARDRSVLAEFVVDLLGLPSAGLGDISTIEVRPVAVFVWADENEQQFVGVAGAAAPGAEKDTPEPPAPPLPAPSASPPSSPAPSVSAAPTLPPSPPPAPIGTAAPGIITGPGQLNATGLSVNSQAVRLYGLEFIPSLSTEAGRRLAGYVKSVGILTCDPRPGNTYRCLTPTNTDLAEAALINGAARAGLDAPPSYRDMESAAKQQKKGIWR